MNVIIRILKEIVAIAERFAWIIVGLLIALIVVGSIVGSPSWWVLLAVAVIGVLLYGEYLRHRRAAR